MEKKHIRRRAPGGGRKPTVGADTRVALRLPRAERAKLDELQTRLGCASLSETVRELIARA